MRVRATPEFGRWSRGQNDPMINRLTRTLVAYLASLPSKPEPTDLSTPLRQADRHELWRIKHLHVDGYAVRLIVWFPPDELDTVFAGNKHPNHDVWYDRATNEAQFAVDHLIRQRSARKSPTNERMTDDGP